MAPKKKFWVMKSVTYYTVVDAADEEEAIEKAMKDKDTKWQLEPGSVDYDSQEK